MTEFEKKLIELLEELPDRLAVALRARRIKKPPHLTLVKPVIAPQDAEAMRVKVSAHFRVCIPGAEEHVGTWFRLGEIEKVVFAVTDESLMDSKRRKTVGAALRLMGALERRRHGFSQFFLALKEPR